MATVRDVFESLNAFAPVETKMDFDNVGFLAGHAGAVISKILLTLDITEEVVDEAAACGAQLIISHHPMFFDLKTITDGDSTGRRVLALLEKGLAAICMHTNLDAAAGGVNDILARTVGIQVPQLLTEEGRLSDGTPYGIGRCGDVEEMPFDRYLAFVKEALGTRGVRYWSAGRPVRRVAVVGGSGGGAIAHAAAQGCDTFVTADVKYDVFLEARATGMNIIDGDHFCTENLVLPVLRGIIAEKYPEIDIVETKIHNQTVFFA